MWALAIYDFGVPQARYDQMTLAEYRALSKRHDQQQKKADFHAAIVAAAVHHAQGNGNVTWKTFMPRYGKPKKKTSNQLLAVAEAIYAMTTGQEPPKRKSRA